MWEATEVSSFIPMIRCEGIADLKDQFSNEKTGRLAAGNFASHAVITDQESQQPLTTVTKSAAIAPSLLLTPWQRQSIRQASRRQDRISGNQRSHSDL